MQFIKFISHHKIFILESFLDKIVVGRFSIFVQFFDKKILGYLLQHLDKRALIKLLLNLCNLFSSKVITKNLDKKVVGRFLFLVQFLDKKVFEGFSFLVPLLDKRALIKFVLFMQILEFESYHKFLFS